MTDAVARSIPVASPVPMQDVDLHAADRKIAIASFHLEELVKAVQQHQPLPVEAPIPVQAHFEGVLYAYVAASDQVERAVRDRGIYRRPNLPGGIPGWEKFKRIATCLADSSLRVDLLKWADDEFFADARWVRNHATHAHYEKVSPQSDLVAIGDWLVEEPSGPYAPTPYGGPRGLRRYGRKAFDHLRDLRELLLSLDDFLQTRLTVSRRRQR